jgi:hypothetical protein
MQKADYLLRLMKQRTDALVASDKKLQQFLMWVNEKSLSVEVLYKPAAIRAFYLDLAISYRNLQEPITVFYSGLSFTFDQELTAVLARVFLERGKTNTPKLNQAPIRDFALDLFLARVLNRCLNCDPPHSIDCGLNYAIVFVVNCELQKSLLYFKAQIQEYQWDGWVANYQSLAEQLRVLMLKYRYIGQDWQFSYQQRKVLQQYYDANKLLVQCLNSASNMTPAVRSHIEETLLLPIAEIEKRDSYQNK